MDNYLFCYIYLTLVMNDELHFQDSFLSLSAFLCLGQNKESLTIHPSPNLNTTDAASQNGGALQDDSESSMGHRHKRKIGKEKKEKKEYSKSYRVRHKEFVQNLKNQNQKYEKKIEELTLKIEALGQEIRCLKYGKQINDKLYDTTFLREKEMVLKQLVNDAENEKQASWQKVKKFANFYGFAGTEKINLLNYYMGQIIDNLLIDHLKNFILSGLQNFQTIKPFAKEIYKKEQEIMGYTPSDFGYLLKFLRKFLPQKIKKFHKSGQDFYQSYVNLINEGREIENQFETIKDGLHKLLPADKYIGVLKWYEENKYCKEIQVLRKEWFQSFLRK